MENEKPKKSDHKELLLTLLAASIAPGGEEVIFPDDVPWEELLLQARRQGVESLLYDELVTKKRLPEQYLESYESACRRTVLQSYRLLFLSRKLIALLEQEHIPAVVLKGVGIAGMYPVPELRKSGDVDILLLAPQLSQKACLVFEQAGLVQEMEQHSQHHIVFRTPESIEVELHTMLAEPFDDRFINRYMQESMQEAWANVVREEVMGVKLPRLGDGEQAYALLLHMLKHYLRAGFGLKLLCDWTVFWNHPHGSGETACYQKMVRESGLTGFSDMVTEVCVRYLGLSRETAVLFWEENEKEGPGENDACAFLEEVFDAGEFGRNERERMVTLRGTGPGAYMREFHHQMKLNYPKAGGHILLWPALWIATLVRFLKNNRKIRHISVGEVLKKAGQRGRLTAKMGLFEHQDIHWKRTGET